MLPSNWFENSACNGCEYGERVTSGVFCVMTQGLVPIGYQGCKAQNDYYEEQYKRENGITLAELAKELRKIFRFKYLVAYAYPGWETPYIELHGLKPRFAKNGGLNQWFFMDTTGGEVNFNSNRLACTLDLSEYADADGNIDYSKCIVEVEE